MKKKNYLWLVVVLILNLALAGKSFSQNTLNIRLEGLNVNDSATVIVQKSSEIYFKQLAVGNNTNVNELTFNLSDGKWAINIDTKGYTFPSSTAFELPGVKTALIKLTPMLNKDFSYTWQDDDSYVGHATQTYIQEPAVIKVLDKEVKVPNDYSSIQLRNKYGVILSDDIEKWTQEDSYRMYKMFCDLPYGTFGEGSKVNPATGENIRGVFKLTKDEQFRDLTISTENGIKTGIISQSAFYYATPQIVTIDGIKGKFFSKRLYHAIVNFVTDFANDESVVDWIAQERFGVRFMKPDQETENLMNEDASDFQEFFKEEKIEILSMFEELPDGFHKQDGLKYLVRRINGQPNPIYPLAPAIAWLGINTIEFIGTAFNGSDLGYIRRLILHEKTHFLWAYTFDENLKNDWIEVGGWFLDPTKGSGWSTYNTTEFVTGYASTNPDEDMAETVSYYLEDPDKLKSVSVRKYEFIRDRVMHGTRYIAQIREDLTFMVYNLFPDYTYPGKVTKIEVNVSGKPEEDKQVTIRVTLNSSNPEIDGASFGYLRFASILGTIHDIGLNPEHGNIDSILLGTATFSKFEKSGYWSLCSFGIWDRVGNARYENTSTVGMKLYIENPLEDVIPPRWNYDLKMEVVEGKFSSSYNTAYPDVNGRELQAIKTTYSFYDDIPFGGSESNFILSTPDKPNYESYFWRLGGGAIIDSTRNFGNGFKSIKHIEAYLKIEEYMPSGYYAITGMGAGDIANNLSLIEFVKDTSDFYVKKPGLYKDVRDSIYVKTKYPDYVKPEIDINHITVSAQPTNPIAPDGETRVEISLIARDLSDFLGQESGVYLVEFVLRNPVGNQFGFQTGNGTMHHPQLDAYNTNPQSGSEWKLYNFDFLLPRGSVPGKWGIASASVTDKAGNKRNYSFVEYVRFDIIESDIVLLEPLEIEITDKLVNAENVNSIDVAISCKPSAGLNYVYTIYSLMGGAVVRGEGIMTSDNMLIEGIDTKGVLDGVLKLTVQLTDSSSQLIATKTVEYDKDTQRPSAYYTRSNLQNEGFSNLDDLVFEIVFGNSEIGGTYDLKIEDYNPQQTNPTDSANNLTGNINSENIILSGLDLSEFNNKVIKTTLTVTDSCLNVGEKVYDYYLIIGDSIKHIQPETGVLMLQVSSNVINIPNIQSSASVNITSNTYWIANSDQLWLTINPTSAVNGDGTINMIASANSTSESRSATVTVLTVAGVQTIIVTQEAGNEVGISTLAEKTIELYPNPNNGHFILELNNIGFGPMVYIYNMSGKMIYQSRITDSINKEINLVGVRRGVYLVKVIDGAEQYTKKMIVN